MINLYVLGLTGGKYYIGKTRRGVERIWEQVNGLGSSWVKRYPPQSLIDFTSNCDPFDEDKLTLMYMARYGIENVRGGSFCEINLTRANRKTIYKMINTASDRCYICGLDGHFADACHYRKY